MHASLPVVRVTSDRLHWSSVVLSVNFCSSSWLSACRFVENAASAVLMLSLEWWKLACSASAAVLLLMLNGVCRTPISSIACAHRFSGAWVSTPVCRMSKRSVTTSGAPADIGTVPITIFPDSPLNSSAKLSSAKITGWLCPDGSALLYSPRFFASTGLLPPTHHTRRIACTPATSGTETVVAGKRNRRSATAGAACVTGPDTEIVGATAAGPPGGASPGAGANAGAGGEAPGASDTAGSTRFAGSPTLEYAVRQSFVCENASASVKYRQTEFPLRIQSTSVVSVFCITAIGMVILTVISGILTRTHPTWAVFGCTRAGVDMYARHSDS